MYVAEFSVIFNCLIKDRNFWRTVCILYNYITIGWRRCVVVSGVRRMNEVNVRRARLVPGWVTVFGRVYHLGM